MKSYFDCTGCSFLVVFFAVDVLVFLGVSVLTSGVLIVSPFNAFFEQI